jgi:ABC-2 type transport system ATP-binding protein
MNAVSIRNVGKTFGDKRAVVDLSLDIPEGSLFGLIGPNGAGKTTTIRMALNIYAPDMGSIHVLGHPMAEGIKSRIGYLPEERGLYTRMKVGEVLIFAAGIKGVPGAEARKRAFLWLDRLGLAECWEKKLQDLSKGMQQKVQFIATVLHEPDLLVLDEPFSGLDPINMDVLRDIILEMHGQGRTVIFSTHIMEQVERLCDRVCMINEGRKVLDGTLQEIRGAHGKNTVMLGFEGDGAFLESHPQVRRASPYKGSVEVTLNDGADPQELLKELVGKVRVSRFEITEPSMHEIFVERVRATGGKVPPAAEPAERAAGITPAVEEEQARV